MAHLCEMNQIGHVASVKNVGKNLIIRIASNANYKTAKVLGSTAPTGTNT